MHFEVAGAWLHGEGDSGEVNIVATVIWSMGHQAEVSAAAVEMDFDDDEEEFILTDEALMGGGATPRRPRWQC